MKNKPIELKFSVSIFETTTASGLSIKESSVEGFKLDLNNGELYVDWKPHKNISRNDTLECRIEISINSEWELFRLNVKINNIKSSTTVLVPCPGCFDYNRYFDKIDELSPKAPDGYSEITLISDVFKADLVKINDGTFFLAMTIKKSIIKSGNNNLSSLPTFKELMNAIISQYELICFNENYEEVKHSHFNIPVRQYQSSIRINAENKILTYSFSVNSSGILYVDNLE